MRPGDRRQRGVRVGAGRRRRISCRLDGSGRGSRRRPPFWPRARRLYAYELSPRNGPGLRTVAGYQWGAGHAVELPYLYPMHDGGVAAAEFTPETSRLADAMARSWGGFAIHGDPATADLPAWPGYGPAKQRRVFAAGGKVEVMSDADFRTEHNCAFWDSFANAPFPMK